MSTKAPASRNQTNAAVIVAAKNLRILKRKKKELKRQLAAIQSQQLPKQQLDDLAISQLHASPEAHRAIRAASTTSPSDCDKVGSGTKVALRVESEARAALREDIIEANRIFSRSLLGANHHFWTNLDSEDSSEVNRQYFEPHEKEWLRAVKAALDEAFPRFVADAKNLNDNQTDAIKLALPSLLESLEENWKPDEIIDAIAITPARRLPPGVSREGYVGEYSLGLKKQAQSHLDRLGRRERLSFSKEAARELAPRNRHLASANRCMSDPDRCPTMTAHEVVAALGLSKSAVYDHPRLVRGSTGTRAVRLTTKSVLAVKNSAPE